eukprot:Hpha_TRINITY_DN20993_c0_g1::TRINITY_DN20993_c0_g1_i1::g.139678::m.139678
MKMGYLVAAFTVLFAALLPRAESYTAPTTSLFDTYVINVPANCSVYNNSIVEVGSYVELGYIGSLVVEGRFTERWSANRRYKMATRRMTIGSLASAYPGLRFSELVPGQTNGILEA